MALVKSFESIATPVRTSASVERDAKLLEDFSTLVPENVTRTAVERFFKEARARQLDSALGQPTKVAELLLNELGHPKDSQKAEAFREALVRELDEASLAPPNKAFLDEETAIARDEIARHWVDTVATAWSMWGEPEKGLVLDTSTLRPEAAGKVSEEWSAVLLAAEGALLATIGLDDSGLQDVRSSFVANLRDRLQHGSVVLPDDLEVVLDGAIPRVRESKPAERGDRPHAPLEVTFATNGNEGRLEQRVQPAATLPGPATKSRRWLAAAGVAVVMGGVLVGTTTQVWRNQTTGLGGEPLGVKECDDYVKKWLACYQTPEARASAKPAFEQVRFSWQQQAKDPVQKTDLKSTCKQATATFACK
jgi:hypothetical protein